jgi:hypothetical protein
MELRKREDEFITLIISLNLGKGKQMERKECRMCYVSFLLNKV